MHEVHAEDIQNESFEVWLDNNIEARDLFYYWRLVSRFQKLYLVYIVQND